MRLDKKIALITGAGSGIGEASAKLCAREGARVVVVDNDAQGGDRVANEIGEGAVFIHADVTKSKDMESMARSVRGRFDRIDILVNNAGVSCVGVLHETSEEEWDRVIAVNTKGVYLSSKYIVPAMIEQRSGCIINMASGTSLLGVAERAAYTASKGAVLSLTRSMQADYARYGIRVNSLVPGTIDTPFVDRFLRKHYSHNMDKAIGNLKKRQLSRSLGAPEDVANAVLYLASDESKFVYGSALVVDGGFLAAKVFD